MTKHEFEVAMTCEGCSGAVARVLNKLGGDVKDAEEMREGREVQRNQVKTAAAAHVQQAKTAAEVKIS
ncbi:hypothetical protein LDENG_00103180 [Lucifuga dentata]|nr:hypothetical protein LDENG_00103180 [Lucifuga dentata]